MKKMDGKIPGARMGFIFAQAVLYVVTAFLFWDISWPINLGATSAAARFVLLFVTAFYEFAVIGFITETPNE